MNKLCLSYDWPAVNADCNAIVTTLNMFAEEDRVIVAINDDLIPATLIANRLGLSVVQVKYGEFFGIDYDDNNIPTIARSIVSGLGLVPNFPKLTIVVSYYHDDAIVKKIKKYYNAIGHYVDVAAICCTPTSPSERTTYLNFVQTGTKLTFPWKI